MAAYYNEIDANAAAWLRELIKRGLIADGEVDERSILDVRADDLRGFVQCHFFAGIGAWSYALRLAEWPDDRPVWTGSCPCQPFSAAGKGEGYADERHLWPHWHRLIRECRPATVFGEQVDAAIRTGWLDDVCLSLESLGYAVGAVDFPAASVGAPHIRNRLYFAADANGEREGAERSLPKAGSERIGSRAVAESEHAERRAQRGPVEDERDRHDGGRAQAHGIAGACGEVRAVADDDEAGRGEQRQRGLSENGNAQRRHDADGRGELDPFTEGLKNGLGDAERAGSQGRERSGDVELHRGARADGSTAAPGPLDTLGIANGIDAAQVREGDDALDEQRSPLGRREQQHAGAGATGGNGDRHSAAGNGERGPLNGFWSDAIWLPCRDGKARPTGRGIEPLVSGTAKPGAISMADEFAEGMVRGSDSSPSDNTAEARVMRLRGYGNSIVASQAAAFISAFYTTTFA